jgi:oligopeptide transport system substrate-binding protein
VQSKAPAVFLRLKLVLVGLLAAQAGAAADRVLERGNGPEPATLDAHRCQEVACGNILRDLYEGLVIEDARGRLVPGMAERWEVSDDGLRWTFHLRPDLRWSNGEPLDAHQLVAGWRRAFTPATAAPFASLLDAIVHAADVQRGERPPEELGIAAPDARTLQFELRRSAPLPALLTLPIAFPVYLPAVEAHGAQHTRPAHLVGNGAYRLVAWTPQASLTLRRNEHFRERAPIESVRFHVTEDAASELKRYQAGDLHVTETVPPARLESLRAEFGEQLRVSPYLGVFYLGFNLERAPFADNPALREALSLAVDRARLTASITGMGETPAYGLVPQGIDDYLPAGIAWAALTQAEREQLARRRYREAGYSDERPLEIELRYNTSTPHRRTALAVASMWRTTLGVRTRLRNEEWKVFVQNRRQRVITQVFRGGWIGDVADARAFLAPFGDDGALNWSGWRDAGFRTLLARADAAPGVAARASLLRDAEQRLLDAHAILPLYFYTSKHLVDPRLDGFEPNPLDRHATRFLRWRDRAVESGRTPR